MIKRVIFCLAVFSLMTSCVSKKIYNDLENKLLFQTGSWAVGNEGRKAVVEVGKVLAQNPDITVFIEGHTDNDKILGNIGGGIENNWDLSTKRATAIVNILCENGGIRKQNFSVLLIYCQSFSFKGVQCF